MRFSVLDSWRGLCALWVVLYHFRVLSHVNDLWFTRSGLLAVDFFFALSGFVIAHAYGEQLSTGAERVRFLIRRFGRLYPLHIATLLVVLAMEAARWGGGLALGHDIGRPTFADETSLSALAANVLLLHGIGLFDSFTWNIPSWSISVEFAVCFIFIAVSLIRRPVLTASVLALAGMLALIWMVQHLPAEGRTALARGVAGFFLGVIVQRIYGLCRAKGWSPPGWLELLTPLAVWATMWLWYKGIWAASAVIFAGLVFLFAFEKGPLSRLLKAPFLIRWGETSYSIYLVHYPMVLAVFGAAAVWQAATGQTLFVPAKALTLGFGSPWIGDLATVAFLVLTVLVARVTYRWIEEPGRKWFNGLSNRVYDRMTGERDG